MDVGIIKDGWVGDNALTVPVGNVGREIENLLMATEESLHIAISFARDGVMLGDLCASIERHVRSKGYSVVREFVGHGVEKNYMNLHKSQIIDLNQTGHDCVVV